MLAQGERPSETSSDATKARRELGWGLSIFPLLEERARERSVYFLINFCGKKMIDRASPMPHRIRMLQRLGDILLG